MEIRIPIETNWAGGYKLEYDGKYITLLGKDKNFTHPSWCNPHPEEYMEMALVPVVAEIRNANPRIKTVTQTEILIETNEK